MVWHHSVSTYFSLSSYCTDFHGVKRSEAATMSNLLIKWDPKNLEIRTKSVEKTLEPLVTQVRRRDLNVETILDIRHVIFIITRVVFLFFHTKVTTLISQKGPMQKKKGQSKKAHVLSAAVQKATENFILRGEEIANENPEIRNDMMAAIDDIRTTGKFKRMSNNP